VIRANAWCLLAILCVLGLIRPASVSAQEIALTFDDLPVHGPLPVGETPLGVASRIVAALADADVPPSHGFYNAALIETDPALGRVLDVWRGAGHRLGNHGWSHANLDTVGAAVFEAEIIRNEPLLDAAAEPDHGRWFRYPYLAEGRETEVRNAIRGVLADRGYGVASVTLDFADYAWNAPYVRCLERGDAAAIAVLEETYLEAAVAALDSSRRLSRQVHGRDVPYVLLLHVGAFDARMMPRLLAMYRARGATFVTLDAAMSDPHYAGDRAAAQAPPATLRNAALARGLSMPPVPGPPGLLESLCR
jgi:peptidoglycan/xylan/chitin deacetylase (PgdA/CDA1 family)